MRLTSLVARGWRNLADGEWALPAEGVALLGANGQGKTNLLEAVAYPVLFRSFRGAGDAELVRHGGEGFHLAQRYEGASARGIAVTWTAAGRRKRIEVDGVEEATVARAVGAWVAVVFQPGDVALAGGPAEERRRFLDRMLSLADPDYLRAAMRYRAALLRRNAALRQHQADVARACEPALAAAGATLVATRLRWVEGPGAAFAAMLDDLGETARAGLRYRGRPELADPAAWPEALREAAAHDRQRGTTTVGPQRDDLGLELDGRAVRKTGSTGQVRSAAVALRLLELETLRAWRGTAPALVLDDIFAELDGERQRRLLRRLTADGAPQCFLSAPRTDELPAGLPLPVWTVREGRVAA